MDKNEPGSPEKLDRREVLRGGAAVITSGLMRGGATLQSTIPATVLASLGVVAGSGAFNSASALTGKDLKDFLERYKKSPFFFPKLSIRSPSDDTMWSPFKLDLGPNKRTWLMFCPAEGAKRCRGGFFDEELAGASSEQDRRESLAVIKIAEIPPEVYVDGASGITSFIVAFPNGRQMYVECDAGGCTADEMSSSYRKEVPKRDDFGQ